MPRSIFRLFPLLILCLLLSGCSALNPFSSKGPETAEELLRAGEQAMEEGSYGRAAKYYQRIQEDHPFSPQTQEAELGLADARFEQGKYSVAESAYRGFESLYPGDPKIPYVLYRIGQANLQQHSSIDLSQRAVQEAEEAFTRLAQAYPDSEYAPRAESRLQECRRLQTHHEVHVADFYMRTGKYQAAWQRYRYVLDSFEGLEEDVADYARARSREAYYLSLRQASEEIRAAKRGSWRQWFQWL